jgi:peptide/nickel transport system substrate-binding protein
MRRTLSLVALAAGCGLLAASALASVSQAPPANTFRLGLNSGGVELDPGFLYQGGGAGWALSYATGAMLFGYPDAPAPRGSRLIPEVAAGFPQVSRDGRTYTIRLKRTYRFNNGRRVAAKHFEFALLRSARSLDGSELIADVVGAKDVRERRAEQISGVRVLDPQTLRIRIRERKPDLLARLALPYFAAVPLNLPPRAPAQKPFLTAGPYSIREWARTGRAVLERNPFYRGHRPRRVHRIQVDVELRPETIKQNVDAGALDAGDVLPTNAHAELARRYGIRRRSPGRYFENPTPVIHYVSFNHDRPLFRGPGPAGNVRLKQAISYAIDRAALVGLLRFGSNVTHDQLLPPSIRGFRDVSMYPRRPNLGRARRLAAGHTRDGKGLIFCESGAREVAAQRCRALQEMLRPIGLELTRSSPCMEFCVKLPEHDLAVGGMRSAHYDPSEFFDLVDGARIDAPAFRPRNEANFNHPAFNRRIRLARQLSGPRRYAAWGRLDADIMRNAAPLVVYGAGTQRHYVSARVGCYHHHPVYGWDFPAICLRR